MSKQVPDPIVLIAEDSEDDQLFLRRAIKESGEEFDVRFVKDGQEAIDYFSATGRFTDRAAFPVPDMFITDLKMPFRDGLEVLQWLRSHRKDLSIVPVIVWSGSTLKTDVKAAYDLGANAYIPKPQGAGQLAALVKKTFDFWAACIVPVKAADMRSGQEG